MPNGFIKRTPRRELGRMLGEVLKELRHRQGVTQLTLAWRSGVDRAFIGHIEAGHKHPSIETLFRLAPPLDTTPSTILAIVEQRIGLGELPYTEEAAEQSKTYAQKTPEKR